MSGPHGDGLGGLGLVKPRRGSSTFLYILLAMTSPLQHHPIAILSTSHCHPIHIPSTFHGHRIITAQHGDDFRAVEARTSIIPFKAVFEGRQTLPSDYYKELIRAPYALIAIGTLGAYFAHPYMQAGAALVQNTGLVEGGILDPHFA